MQTNQTVNKRMNSTQQYIDALQDKYAKLNVIRIDFAYKKPHSKNMTLDDGNKDFNKMLNNRRGKPTLFRDQVGHICLKEFTPNRGVHFHTVFFYDGNKVQKDAFMGDKLGEYWKEITDGKGSHFNCNRQKYKFQGVGMLHHSDTQKREVLDKHVISYLCKDDEKQDLAPAKSNKKSRAFVRGTMPKKKEKIGRPRNKKVD